MDQKLTFRYFYGNEADQYSFYRIPKLLFKNEYFKNLSSDAKILYGLMLDRMSLSIKNQWFDEQNRAYIYFSIEDIMELLNCGRNKAVKSLQELDDENGIGLIEKRRQGFGKANIIYVKDNWALSTYDGNVSLINNYILPIIGDEKLSEINTRFIEKYYQRLLKAPAVVNPIIGKRKNEYVSTSTIRDIHKLLRSCFKQAVKWELMEKNPCIYATVPKHKTKKREIWTAETLMYALEVCEDDRLKLAMNLSFSCSLRISELLGLTWDCVDISEEAIEENRAYLFINKESQRVSKSALKELDAKDVLLIFPEKSKTNKTVRVLKTPKTDSSVRKVFLPKSVAKMLIEWKEKQDETKEVLGDEYMDYNLVMASTFGLPLGDGAIRKPLNQLIKDYDLPPVVFHSLRHSSVTYKLKLNGGDIKAVQGDSGHAQVSMVTDVYSHILDDDRKKNAELFEEAFYEKKDLDPQMHPNTAQNTVAVPEGVDAELLAKVLNNPEMAALLTSLAKTMK